MGGISIIAVPTTYSGPEATSLWAMTVSGVKEVHLDDRAFPTTVIYDSDLRATLPAELAALSGINAVAHCIDIMWASSARRIDQAPAMEGLQTFTLGFSRGRDAECTGTETEFLWRLPGG